MNKMISAVISLMLVLSFGASYSAVDKYDYTVNGTKISAQPYYSGDVLMVPALETAETLGYINEYDPSLGRLRTCLHKKCVRIFEHNFVAE